MSDYLNNAEVCREAIDAVDELTCTSGAAFERFYGYLLIDEPIIQLMPAYFLPFWAEHKVQPEALRALALAAKLENARNRWLDSMVDGDGTLPLLTPPQALNEAVVGLTARLYAKALPRGLAARFFERLAVLYARHSMSLVLDGKRQALNERPITLADYEVHAKARHSSVRAPLDALMIMVQADEEQRGKATDSWHAWGLGAQLYDDALDVEEDFRNGNLTWTVSRTLQYFQGTLTKNADEFYAVSLQEGVVSETLRRAEAHFRLAAELACSSFPRWATVQDGCMRQARTLREDYERVLGIKASGR